MDTGAQDRNRDSGMRLQKRTQATAEGEVALGRWRTASSVGAPAAEPVGPLSENTGKIPWVRV